MSVLADVPAELWWYAFGLVVGCAIGSKRQAESPPGP